MTTSANNIDSDYTKEGKVKKKNWSILSIEQIGIVHTDTLDYQ